jgi:hypothetical protein
MKTKHSTMPAMPSTSAATAIPARCEVVGWGVHCGGGGAVGSPSGGGGGGASDWPPAPPTGTGCGNDGGGGGGGPGTSFDISATVGDRAVGLQ